MPRIIIIMKLSFKSQIEDIKKYVQLDFELLFGLIICISKNLVVFI